MKGVIYYQGRRYYWYDSFDHWHEARRVIERYRNRYRKRGSKIRYHVVITEGGLLYPRKFYNVYFDKVRRLFA